MAYVDLVEKFNTLKQEHDTLFKKTKLFNALSLVAKISMVIAAIVYFSMEIKYDLNPIDKTTFNEYSRSTPYSEFAQANMASIEDVFTITTYTDRSDEWDNMYNYDSTGLTDSAQSTYNDLLNRYNTSANQSSYSYLYAVGKTDDQLPCLLRLSGEDAYLLDKYLDSLDDFFLAAAGYKQMSRTVYGRAVELTPLSDLENASMFSEADSDFFVGRPKGMKDDAYYKLLQTYPVIDLEDVAAYDKKVIPQSVTEKNIALYALILVAASIIVFWIMKKSLAGKLKAIQIQAAEVVVQIKSMQAQAQA